MLLHREHMFLSTKVLATLPVLVPKVHLLLHRLVPDLYSIRTKAIWFEGTAISPHQSLPKK